MFQPDFIQIPSIVAFSPDLQDLDTKVYGIVYWFQRMKDGRCTASNQLIADICRAKPFSVADSLSRLEKAGFIIRIFKDNEKHIRTEIRCLVKYGRVSADDDGVSATADGGVSAVNEQIKNIDTKNRMISPSPKSLLVEKEESDEEIEVNANIDDDGNEITNDRWGKPLKRPAAKNTPKNKENTIILTTLSQMCHKAIGIYPVLDIVSYQAVSFARNTGGLTDKQIYSLYQDRLDAGLPDDEVVSIPRALSARQIEKFKIHAQI